MSRTKSRIGSKVSPKIPGGLIWRPNFKSTQNSASKFNLISSSFTIAATVFLSTALSNFLSCRYCDFTWTLCKAILSSNRMPGIPVKMGVVSFITGVVAPIFIIISPITSYADQTYAIHRTRSSAGFSLDIPLIMLVSSLLR
jgi:hypothetical protein